MSGKAAKLLRKKLHIDINAHKRVQHAVDVAYAQGKSIDPKIQISLENWTTQSGRVLRASKRMTRGRSIKDAQVQFTDENQQVIPPSALPGAKPQPATPADSAAPVEAPQDPPA